MVLKPSISKITDYETSFDATPEATPDGEVIWADVRIDYILLGDLTPQVTIRVPVPWSLYETSEQRRSKALRNARELIDHACRASGIGPREPEVEDDAVANAIGDDQPSILEGVAQELGLAQPTTKLKPKNR